MSYSVIELLNTNTVRFCVVLSKCKTYETCMMYHVKRQTPSLKYTITRFFVLMGCQHVSKAELRMDLYVRF